MSTVTLDYKSILVTGAAGFIGSNLVKRIYQEAPSAKVIGIDNMNAYYDVALKEFRLNELAKHPTFTCVKGNIADKELITELFEKYKPSVVVNLAAQAGMRYSITNPDAYVESNLVGFFNILEACRHSYDDGQTGVEHLVYASSSSVYGSNKKVPYSTDDKVDNPVSLYAATKKSNELMAHAYSKAYGIMAASKPILGVLELGSEVRCLIEDTHGGLCCEPGEYDKVEENIRWFIENAENSELKAMGARGRENLEKNLTRSVSVRKYAEEILKL